MSFTFLHTADWQLGKLFGTLPPDIAALVRDARLGAIDRIAGLAARSGARHVLVAGDVFDTVTVTPELLGKTLARLLQYPSLVWHLLPGNHDPIQPGSVWQMLAAQLKSQSVRLHLSADPVEIEPGIVLLPAPLKAKSMSTDPTQYMDAHASAPGVIRIGLAHGSVRGFGSMGDAAVPIDPARAAAAKLDYLALGDWHGTTRINERTWYSGTPEPDRTKDNDAGETLAVTIAAAGAVPIVARHRTAAFLWLERTVEIRSADDLGPLAKELSLLGAPAQAVLLDLTLEGQAPLSGMAALAEAVAGIRAQARHLDLDQTAVSPVADAADLAATFTGGLTTVAAALAARQATGDADAQRIAGRALRMLAQFAGSARS